ncbi:hypothetical protein JCGZ_00486 [Jatropha curcas]|uniref:Uncharacterized protein n=1 Tax=Jatropha curcas TaxID=180498 RepID=A0A067L313_JATCU|nr:hypothetical protein JCGZ_00486 [Jatropha curcas]
MGGGASWNGYATGSARLPLQSLGIAGCLEEASSRASCSALSSALLLVFTMLKFKLCEENCRVSVGSAAFYYLRSLDREAEGNPVVSVKSRSSGTHNKRPPCGLPSNPDYQVRPIRDHPVVFHIIQIISSGAHGVPISHMANGLVDCPHKPMSQSQYPKPSVVINHLARDSGARWSRLTTQGSSESRSERRTYRDKIVSSVPVDPRGKLRRSPESRAGESGDQSRGVGAAGFPESDHERERKRDAAAMARWRLFGVTKRVIEFAGVATTSSW